MDFSIISQHHWIIEVGVLQDRQGLAVAAGHRLLTRTREQEPMGRPRRTRTREPPGGAQPSPARAHGRAPPDAKRASWRMGGWRGRAHTHPGGSPWPGESEIAEAHCPASPTPPPRRGDLSWGMPPAVGIVGPEDPRPQPSSRGGANVDSRAPLIGLLGCRLAGFAGLPGSLPLPSTPPLPGWLQGAMGGPAVGEARRQPPAAIRSSSPGHWPATGSRILPGPGGVPDEGQLLHHLRPSPPRPPGRRLIGTGASTRNNQNTGI
jgi:hypothetical protein